MVLSGLYGTVLDILPGKKQSTLPEIKDVLQILFY